MIDIIKVFELKWDFTNKNLLSKPSNLETIDFLLWSKIYRFPNLSPNIKCFEGFP